MSTASGIRATEGIGRRNSTVVCVARRRNGTSPMIGAEHGRGDRRDQQTEEPRRHRAADVAPELEVAELREQPRQRLRRVGQILRADDAERRDQLPDDQESDDAGGARAATLRAYARRASKGSHDAVRVGLAAGRSVQRRIRCGMPRRTEASRSATAAGSACRGPARRRAPRTRWPAPTSSSMAATSTSEVNSGSVMPAAASSGMPRLSTIAARTASSFAGRPFERLGHRGGELRHELGVGVQQLLRRDVHEQRKARESSPGTGARRGCRLRRRSAT